MRPYKAKKYNIKQEENNRINDRMRQYKMRQYKATSDKIQQYKTRQAKPTQENTIHEIGYKTIHEHIIKQDKIKP